MTEERTEREWFTRDRRGAIQGHSDEEEARDWLENSEDTVQAFYRDVTYGPLVEVER